MNLTQKLKLLKNIHPQKKWLQDTKDLFLMQAKNELFFRKQEGEILNFAFWKLFFRPISALGAIMLLFFGSSVFAINISKDTLPGDPLYVIKINLEKTQKVLTNNKEKRVGLAINSSNERLKELKKLSHFDSSVKGEKNIKAATQNLDEGIKEIQASLNDLKKEENFTITIKTAKIVDAQTIEYKKELLQTKTESTPLIKEEIEKALISTEETNSHAFQTIINEHKVAEKDSVLEKEVIEIIENKIKQTEGKIKEVKVKATDLAKIPEKQEVIIDGQGGEQIDLIDQQKIEIIKVIEDKDKKDDQQKTEDKKDDQQKIEIIKVIEDKDKKDDQQKIEIIKIGEDNETKKQKNKKTPEQNNEGKETKVIDQSKIETIKNEGDKSKEIDQQKIEDNKEKSKEILKETKKAEEILKEVKESLKQKDSDKIDLNVIADKVVVSKKLVNIAEKVADKAVKQ